MNTPTIEDVLNKQAKEVGMIDFSTLLKSVSLKQFSLVSLKNVVHAAMTEYASLNRQGWTRVEDGLPEFAGEYLCKWENPNRPHYYDVLMFSVDGKWRVYDSVADDYEEAFASVSHWMPLPNKPV